MRITRIYQRSVYIYIYIYIYISLTYSDKAFATLEMISNLVEDSIKKAELYRQFAEVHSQVSLFGPE